MTRLVRITAAVVVAIVLTQHPARSDDDDGGTISGTIEVSGVKSPENVLVYVEKVPGEWDAPKDPAHMDQVKLVFTPRVLPIVKGTTVEFRNSDPILHNVFWPKSKDRSYSSKNLGTWGKGGKREYKFDKEGSVVLLCNVHPEMEGFIVIRQNPFFALADKDGKYEIEGVPEGDFTVKTWYENPKKLRAKSSEVSVKTGETATVDFSLSRR
jgi:plastocyanin